MPQILINKELLGFVAGILGIILSLKKILSWNENKIKENNRYLESLINTKVDKNVYEEHKKIFENNIEKRLDKMEKTLDDINSYLLNKPK